MAVDDIPVLATGASLLTTPIAPISGGSAIIRDLPLADLAAAASATGIEVAGDGVIFHRAGDYEVIANAPAVVYVDNTGETRGWTVEVGGLLYFADGVIWEGSGT